MYRLVLYVLMALIAAAAVLGFFGYLPYGPVEIIYSAIFITITCWIFNTIAAWAFDAPTNVESVYITALILALIIAPVKTVGAQYFAFIFWASAWAIVSKYFIAIGKKHIFNPAAFAVALTAMTISQSANWWVGTAAMLPFAAIGGFLIVRKIKRADLVWSFFITAAISVFGFALSRGESFSLATNHFLLNSPLVFFATVMLTEPLTTPPTRGRRIFYGALVGFLFAPQTHIGSLYFTPELALLAGNIFSYLASPKQKLVLELEKKVKLAPAIFDFVFRPNKQIKFKPGQYLEWTLEHAGADSRGNRRYFTIASSPTERRLVLGVKFYEPPSSFKQALWQLNPGDKIIASQLAGDFTLPKNRSKKLVFMAGGIGITPFRSMVKYLLDRNESRPITVFYSGRSAEDIVYDDVFESAADKLGIKTIYTITDPAANPQWQGARGLITEQTIAREVPDYYDRIFYLSGPRSMVTGFEKTLENMGVGKSSIKTDYFPGFA